MQGRREVFQELRKEHPSMKLLYTTPEQLQSSEGLLECLHDLCTRCMPELSTHPNRQQPRKSPKHNHLSI